MLVRLSSALAPGADNSRLSAYELAQLHELGFWRWVAFEGYNGADPRTFPWSQRLLMTSMFLKTGRRLDGFTSIVEIGCGPLGMIQFLPAPRRVGFDPLNAHYARLFSKARGGGVAYVTDLDALCRDGRGSFDLSICFNVLDHAADARALFDAFVSLVKPGGHFLLQVNTVRPGDPRSPEHAMLRLSPLSVGTVREWVAGVGTADGEELAAEPSPENELFYVVWGRKHGHAPDRKLPANTRHFIKGLAGVAASLSLVESRVEDLQKRVEELERQHAGTTPSGP